ncbi:hypothetical protein P3T22_004409 [Paraburkholderia sp. GAS348]
MQWSDATDFAPLRTCGAFSLASRTRSGYSHPTAT